jgi:hypothetical protein
MKRNNCYILLITLILMSCNPSNPTPPNCKTVYTVQEKWLRPATFVRKDTTQKIQTCSPVIQTRDTFYFWEYYLIIYTK